MAIGRLATPDDISKHGFHLTAKHKRIKRLALESWHRWFTKTLLWFSVVVALQEMRG